MNGGDLRRKQTNKNIHYIHTERERERGLRNCCNYLMFKVQLHIFDSRIETRSNKLIIVLSPLTTGRWKYKGNKNKSQVQYPPTDNIGK